MKPSGKVGSRDRTAEQKALSERRSSAQLFLKVSNIDQPRWKLEEHAD
jgi:hypothetical protein